MINDDLTVSTFDRILTDLLKHGHVLRKKKKTSSGKLLYNKLHIL